MTLNLKPSIDAVTDALLRIIADATAALELAPDGLRRMADGQAGYPTGPSSAPATMPEPLPRGVAGWACPSKDCAVTSESGVSFHAHWVDEHGPTKSTQPERFGAVAGDEAARHAAQLVHHLRGAASHLVASRRLLETYGVTKVGHAAVANPVNDNLWCTSCLQDHRHSERRPGGTQCWWCAKKLAAINGIRREHAMDPLTLVPVAMVRKHAQGRVVTAADIEHWALTDQPIRPRVGARRPQRQATRDLRETRIPPAGVL